MKVGIAGIGGIGSNVARHLAQARVESVKIVDQDLVEASNLNRQFYRMSQVGRKKTDSLVENLRDIFPEMIIEKKDMILGPGDAGQVFSDCDIVVEGFDNKVLKKMLIEELSLTGKTLVSASGVAGTDMSRVAVKKMGNCPAASTASSASGFPWAAPMQKRQDRWWRQGLMCFSTGEKLKTNAWHRSMKNAARSGKSEKFSQNLNETSIYDPDGCGKKKHLYPLNPGLSIR